MHQPLPYGYFGPDDIAPDDVAFAERLTRRITNIKQLGGFDSLRLTQALPSGNGTVTALDMGGVRKVFVSYTPRDLGHQSELSDSVTGDVPMLFSGVVKKARVLSGEKVVIQITQQTQKRLGHYGAPVKDDEKYDTSQQQALERFTIPLSQRFSELIPQNQSDRIVTQYEDLRPCWYSGAMASVVQIVGGYGKLEFPSKPSNKTELARLRIPKDVQGKIERELRDYRLFACTGKPPADGSIRYDYKHQECHGVAKGQDGARWLVRVSSIGVYAMPLPMIPATTTNAFREWVEEVGDDELLWCIENFGGLPSGESFPAAPGAFKAWERAGVIVKVCDTADFYEHAAYSSACGWSFNKSGTVAYNTCYDYDEGEGLAYGLLYRMGLSFGAISEPPKKKPLSDSEINLAGLVAKYVSAIKKEAGRNSDEGPAVIYKIKMATFSEIASRAASKKNGTSDFDYWANLTLPKIAAVSGGVFEESRGWLNTRAGYENQPQLKFPEPMLRGCVSFDFRPLVNGRFKQVKCDTPVYAFFSPDDDLHITKYFFDPAVTKSKVDGDFEDCMTVGTWSQTVYAGGGAIQGNFYSNEIDDRKTVSSKTTTVVTGTDLGYSVRPYHVPFYTFAMTGTMGRFRYYAQKIKSTITAESMNIAVCIPFYSRGSILFARRDYQGYVETRESVTRQSVRDPNVYGYYTVHFPEAQFRTPTSDDWRTKVSPPPEKGVPIFGSHSRKVDEGGGGCSDFADGGPWAGSGVITLDGFIGPVTNGWGAGRGDVAPPCHEYSTVSYTTPDPTGVVKFQGLGGTSTLLTEAPDVRYFLNSPNVATGMFLRECIYVTAGRSEYATVSEKSSYGKQWSYGYTRAADSTSMHHFIGVINE